MRFAIIEGDVVANITVAEAQFAAEQGWIEATGDVAIGDHYVDGLFVRVEAPPKSPEEIQAEIVASTQARLDAFARTRNYGGILSACTYATSPTAKFAAEGQRAVELRDATWATLYAILADVQAGRRPMPGGFADIEADLPVLEWPA